MKAIPVPRWTWFAAQAVEKRQKYPGAVGFAAAGSRVLVIGLDPYRVPGPWDPEQVARAIDAGIEGLAKAGLEAETCLVGLDGSDDIEALIVAALEGGRFDCVVVGGGLRTSDELLGLFEAVINLVRRHAPGAEIAFNTAPNDLVDAVARRLG